MVFEEGPRPAATEDLMTYATSRDEASYARLQTAIEDFASQYGLNANSSGPRRTIFLFPGGLGSDLMRSYQAYPNPAQSFEKVWLDIGIWVDVPRLGMLPGDVDSEQKYVVADGCVDIPGPIALFHAYEVFIQWCRRNSIDLFVFGWDWRRSVQDAADFFLNVFMPKFDARFAGMTPHPLDHFSFVGHSAGGMVVKAMLNSATNSYVQRVKKAITVATPFYGYGDQIRRFIMGDPYLLVAGFPRSFTARLICSLPGGYEYPYLDSYTYGINQMEFTQDPDGYNLNAYPSLDADNHAVIADPYVYDPQRYPPLTGFQSGLLSRGNATARKISSPLTDAAIAAKFYNIRGVQQRNNQDIDETAVGQFWARVSPWFSPDFDPDPIQSVPGPGDGTQPAWTTKLLGLPDPARQIITIKGDDVDHATMLDIARVRAKIAELIGLNPASLDFDDDVFGFAELMATLEEFNEFRQGMAKMEKFARKFRPEQFSALKSQHLRQYTPAQLQRLLARYYVETVNHPGKIRVPSKHDRPPVSKGKKLPKGEKPADDRGPAGKK